MKKYMLLILAILWLGLVAACLADEVDTITDATGTEVPMFLDAQRIVSLAPNVTEMIYFVGLGDRLVGRSDFCDYPPEVLDLPSVGGFIDTSLEAIVALDPDLVIAYQGNSLELVEQLRALGITVFALAEATSRTEIGGQIFGVQATAGTRELCEQGSYLKYVEKLADMPIGRRRQFTFFYGYPGELMYSCAPGTYISRLIELAGGENIITDESISWPQVSAEFVIAANPDYVLTSTECTVDQDPATVRLELIQRLQRDVFWSQLDAVQNNRVIVVDADLINRPGPRITEAYDSMIAQLEPEHRPSPPSWISEEEH